MTFLSTLHSSASCMRRVRSGWGRKITSACLPSWFICLKCCLPTTSKQKLQIGNCQAETSYWTHLMFYVLPWWCRVKSLPANAGDTGLIPGSTRFPREGNGNPFWYSCLGNSVNRGAWWASVQRVQRVRHD